MVEINHKLFNEANESLPSLCVGEERTLQPIEIEILNRNLIELIEVKKRINSTLLQAKKRFNRYE